MVYTFSTIPLQSVPSQTLDVSLGGQFCRINVYTKRTGMYVDLYLINNLIIAGVLALNGVRIVRDLYFGFVGDLIFIDTEGNSDPQYQGLGTRYQFVYVGIA